jgi:hypothetical protein
MMKPRSIMTINLLTLLPHRGLLTIGLLVVLLAVGCAPTNPTALESDEAPMTESVAESAPLATATQPAPSADVAPAATSRGPGLHATNPAEVSLASGELQLVEFFRFT